jgi:ATP-dependent DNA ligase
VALPLSPPHSPQLARTASGLPTDEGWAYEPKYDGFRAIAFVDGGEAHLQSRNGRPLHRYFPEVTFPEGRYVVDGELVIRDGKGHEDFDALQNRIHPAASRIERLAGETPATFIAFDLLALDDENLIELPYADRRVRLEAFVQAPMELAPSVRTPAEAEQWLQNAEGVIAKRLDSPYLPGERKAMCKIKRLRTLDCVVAGWRPGKEAGTVGSLMLGLFDGGEELRVVGHTSGLKAAEKKALVDKLAPYETGDRGSADPSRWRPDDELEWIALRPELVIEVSFDHVSGGRIRHGAKLLRWREDKDPSECRLDQLA